MLDDAVTRAEDGRYLIRRPLWAEEVLQVAEAIVTERMFRECKLTRPEDTFDYFSRHLALCPVEKFCAAFLDSQLGVLALETLSVGTLAATTVFPREVVKAALQHNAAAVIFAHNHPSGSTQPSHADSALTEQLVRALRSVDIRVVDHVIVAGNKVVSMAQLGLL